MGSNTDLRKYQDSESIQEAFSKIVSGGKPGYKTILERKKIPPRCSVCGRGGEEDQKFCPQCGGKMVLPLTHCPSCKKSVNETEKFCTNCGKKLKE